MGRIIEHINMNGRPERITERVVQWPNCPKCDKGYGALEPRFQSTLLWPNQSPPPRIQKAITGIDVYCRNCGWNGVMSLDTQFQLEYTYTEVPVMKATITPVRRKIVVEMSESDWRAMKQLVLYLYLTENDKVVMCTRTDETHWINLGNADGFVLPTEQMQSQGSRTMRLEVTL